MNCNFFQNENSIWHFSSKGDALLQASTVRSFKRGFLQQFYVLKFSHGPQNFNSNSVKEISKIHVQTSKVLNIAINNHFPCWKLLE